MILIYKTGPGGHDRIGETMIRAIVILYVYFFTNN